MSFEQFEKRMDRKKERIKNSDSLTWTGLVMLASLVFGFFFIVHFFVIELTPDLIGPYEQLLIGIVGIVFLIVSLLLGIFFKIVTV